MESPLSARVSAWTQPYSPGPLSKEECEFFYEHGWLIKERVLSEEDLRPVCGAVDRLVDGLAERLHAGGKIADKHADKGFEERLSALERDFHNASVLLHKDGVLPAEVAALWGGPTLMGIAKQLLGQEEGILAHPVWNLRTKTPQTEQAVVPWHQDSAYLSPDCQNALQLTAWVPLVDATEANGCMQVVDGGHRKGIEVPHEACVGDTWYIKMAEGWEEKLGVDLDRDLRTCEVPAGGVLLINNFIPHRSLPNTSSGIRWSLDLRWQSAKEPVGFYGLKEGLVVRDPEIGEGFRPEWERWGAVSRSQLQEKTDKKVKAAKETGGGGGGGGGGEGGEGGGGGGGGGGGVEEEEKEEFDTIITGPWMDRWPITHENRHTEKHKALKDKGIGLSGWHAKD